MVPAVAFNYKRRLKILNIGIFTDTYFPQISGVATSIKTLKEELEKRGHQVYIFTTTDPLVAKGTVEPQVYRFGSVPFPSFTERRVAIRGLFKAVTIARRLKLDLVHTQTEFSMGYIGKYVAHALKIPAVHTYHTMYEDYLHYIMNGHLLHPSGVKQLSRAFLYHMTGLICPSQRVMDTMIRYGIKIPMRIIPTGVDLSQYTQKVDFDLRAAYQIPQNAQVILSVSRVAYEKNIDFLLRSFAQLLKKRPQVYLVIVGDGPAIDDLRQQAQDLKIAAQVIFTGYVKHSQVVAYYQQADIFASASNTEAQGLTFIEALAAHTQVLAWDNDYDRNLLADSSLGAVFSTEEQLTALMLKYLTKDIPLKPAVLKPELAQISATHFGEKVLEFYHDLQEHFEGEKLEELNEEEVSMMRRVSGYLKLSRSHDHDEELNQYPIGYAGEGKNRSLILSSFVKQNYQVYALPSEDNSREIKKVTIVPDLKALLAQAKIIFVEITDQDLLIHQAQQLQKDQILVNLGVLHNFEPAVLRQKSADLSGKLLETTMLINDFESISLLVGGDQDLYQEIAPIFEVFTDESLYVGEIGSAQIGIKALNILRDQLRTGVQQALTSVQDPGVDLNAILDLLADTDETELIRHWGNQELNKLVKDGAKSSQTHSSSSIS